MCVTLVPVPVPEYSVSVPVYDAVRDDVVHDLPALAGRRNACVFVLVGRESLLETQGDLRFSTLRFSLRPCDEREPALLQPPSLSLLALAKDGAALWLGDVAVRQGCCSAPCWRLHALGCTCGCCVNCLYAGDHLT